MAYKNNRKVMAGPDAHLLLIGRTSNGKSATGDSILGQKKFKPMGGPDSQTLHASAFAREYKGRIITVVDLPGLGDTRTESEVDALKRVIEEIKNGLDMSLQGFTAILLVLPCNAGNVDEEIRTVKILKRILGDDFLSKHTIVVFTHGDSFKFNNQDKDVEFSTWIRTKMEKIEWNIINECGGRFVLFDNMTSDVHEQESQLNDLILKIEELESNHSRYNIDHFIETLKNREGMINELYLNLRIDECLKHIDFMKFDLLQIHLLNEKSKNVKHAMKMNELLVRIIGNEESAQIFDKLRISSGELRSYLKSLNDIIDNLNSISPELEQIQHENANGAEMQKKPLEEREAHFKKEMLSLLDSSNIYLCNMEDYLKTNRQNLSLEIEKSNQ